MFLRKKLKSKVREIQQQKQIGYETKYDSAETTYEEQNDSVEGNGVKQETIYQFFSSDLEKLFIRLETLLGITLQGHNNTLSEASAVLDKLLKKEYFTKEECNNAISKFSK